VLDDARVQAAVMSFALLAEPTRVRLLWALRDQDADVSSLAAAAGCRPTVASQHLSKLRFAGLVEGHRQYNPGWHLALDLPHMLTVSECIARAALEGIAGVVRDAESAATRPRPPRQRHRHRLGFGEVGGDPRHSGRNGVTGAA
jgi:DNA-binding transcriptional ArsR family regulator